LGERCPGGFFCESDDFMFRLTKEEKDDLVTNCDRYKILLA